MSCNRCAIQVGDAGVLSVSAGQAQAVFSRPDHGHTPRCEGCGAWYSPVHGCTRCQNSDRNIYRHGQNGISEAPVSDLSHAESLFPAGINADLLGNEFMAQMYSDHVSIVIKEERKVHLETEGPASFSTDLRGNITAHAYPLGKHAPPEHNILVTWAGIYHEQAHDQITPRAMWDNVLSISNTQANYGKLRFDLAEQRVDPDWRGTGNKRGWPKPGEYVIELDRARPLVSQLTNIIEDGRIERWLSKEYPGAGEILAASCRLEERWGKDVGENVPALNQLMGALLYESLPFYRVDPETERNMKPEAKKLLDEVRPILARAVNGSADDVYFATLIIANRIERSGILPLSGQRLPVPDMRTTPPTNAPPQTKPATQLPGYTDKEPTTEQQDQQGQNQQGQNRDEKQQGNGRQRGRNQQDEYESGNRRQGGGVSQDENETNDRPQSEGLSQDDDGVSDQRRVGGETGQDDESGNGRQHSSQDDDKATGSNKRAGNNHDNDTSEAAGSRGRQDQDKGNQRLGGNSDNDQNQREASSEEYDSDGDSSAGQQNRPAGLGNRKGNQQQNQDSMSSIGSEGSEKETGKDISSLSPDSKQGTPHSNKEVSGEGDANEGEASLPANDPYAPPPLDDFKPMSDEAFNAMTSMVGNEAAHAIRSGVRQKYGAEALASAIHRPLPSSRKVWTSDAYTVRNADGSIENVPVYIAPTTAEPLTKYEEEVKATAKGVAKYLRTVRTQVERQSTHQNEGKLDRRRWAAALKGSNRVRIKDDKAIDTSLSVSLIGDMSGSMKKAVHNGDLYKSMTATGRGLEEINEHGDVDYDMFIFSNQPGIIKARKEPKLDSRRAAKLQIDIPDNGYGYWRSKVPAFGGGTAGSPVTALAATSLRGADSRNRLMVMMTDGDFNISDRDNVVRELAKAREDGILTYGIFFDSNGAHDPSKAIDDEEKQHREKRLLVLTNKMDELYGPGNWSIIRTLDEMPMKVFRRIASIFQRIQRYG